MRFKEKTYLITLIIFLIFLNAGIFSLAYYTQQKNAASAETLCISEYAVITEAFEDDTRLLSDTGRVQVIRSFVSYYAQKDIRLQFADGDGKIISSSLPNGVSVPDKNELSTQRTDGKRFIIISNSVSFGQYTMTYLKDVSYLDEDFKSISIVFVLTSLGASALLAVILFFVLGRLSSPLERLKSATEEIANGNFAARADESGRDEFALLASDFNRMAEHISVQMDELTESAKTKQAMLDNLAHEMRTPLTSIRGYAEYLLNANIGEDEKIESIEFIISESERLKRIGERLLDEAFIRENGITAEKTDLGELISDAAKKLSFIASQSGVELRVEAKSVSCLCDKVLMEILVTNLINNAVKACKNGGRVVIGCDTDGKKAVISVRDNGIGMTKDQLKRITEPFYRTDRSRSRNGGGTGLGLSLCERIAKAHSACLSFDSALNEGTTATVIINL